jgi:hypothetical protein
VQYLLLIYDEEKLWNRMSQAQIGAVMERWGAFHQEIEQSGVVKNSNRLQPVSAATTLKVAKGDAVTTDGPFAETKEQLGGYYLIDVPDLDAALQWARKIPIPEGSIEVRPIMEMEP